MRSLPVPVFVVLGVAAILATSANAATVTSEKGELLVNRGSGYKPVRQPTEAAVGDRVLARPNSSGRIEYPDGCVVKVSPGAIFTVVAKSPCVSGGYHIETQASTTSQPPPGIGNDVVPFLGVLSVPVGMMLLPQSDKAASP
jgi:hypothetical protein